MLLYQILASTIHGKKTKNSYRNNKFKTSAPKLNDKFELPNGSYSASDIQDYFEYINKKHETLTGNLPIQTYVNRIEIRITFKIKTGYYPELLTPETMKLLGNTEKKIIKDKSSKNVPHLDIIEVVLVHCNNVNNDYQYTKSTKIPTIFPFSRTLFQVFI